MRLPEAPRRPARESIIPMINVVFLLLIFFLMTAEIAPPQPFAVTPPRASTAAPAARGVTLYISAGGQVGFRDRTGPAALALLSGQLAAGA